MIRSALAITAGALAIAVVMLAFILVANLRAAESDSPTGNFRTTAVIDSTRVSYAPSVLYPLDLP